MLAFTAYSFAIRIRSTPMRASLTVPVPVDEQGLDVAEGLRRAPRFRLAFVTPSHQQPLGVVMSLERRFALLKAAERAAVEKAKHWLERVGLIARADDPAGDLPYGAQRRLEIARAMCSDPVLLCLDEPAAGLNPRESAELNALLRSIRDSDRVSILLIEHDMSVVMEISDHIVVLEYGAKISDGPPDFIRNDPRVIQAYLGVEDEDVPAIVEAVR